MFPGEAPQPAGSGYKEALIAGGCFALAALSPLALTLAPPH